MADHPSSSRTKELPPSSPDQNRKSLYPELRPSSPEQKQKHGYAKLPSSESAPFPSAPPGGMEEHCTNYPQVARASNIEKATQERNPLFTLFRQPDFKQHSQLWPELPDAYFQEMCHAPDASQSAYNAMLGTNKSKEEKLSSGDDNLWPTLTPEAQIFPVNLNRTPQRPLPWYPIEHTDIKRLREVVRDDGLNSPYAQELLDNIGINLNTPRDWHQLARAVLTSGQYINWKAHYQDQCERQAEENQSREVQLNLECLLGTGIYSNPAVYVQAPPQYWDQVRHCALRVFKNCSATKTDKITKLIQKKDEDFSTFVSRVQEACTRKVENAQAQEVLARELILDGANSVCKQAIGPIRTADIHDWILACKDLDQNTPILATTLAKTLAEAMALSQNATCFNCKAPGHFAKECPQKGQPTRPKPPTPCPRCHRGYHWAKDCRSKIDREGKPLNSKWGTPQPHTQGVSPTCSTPKP
ncbi:endogenous retrovirus group K member 5 Gag polyprotein-like [Dasypus novemcinctus]|uniref:endogenous retrovirus group K member 5 Gag polyprotein-like n=1 Tax=Dasypus novemcinctus TaxID=9361 RepID=UPI00265F9436|nr:endogenous retrovirus group K member 5 Gag polyprotein-like [Dasypus novemcinctus]